MYKKAPKGGRQYFAQYMTGSGRDQITTNTFRYINCSLERRGGRHNQALHVSHHCVAANPDHCRSAQSLRIAHHPTIENQEDTSRTEPRFCTQTKWVPASPGSTARPKLTHRTATSIGTLGSMANSAPTRSLQREIALSLRPSCAEIAQHGLNNVPKLSHRSYHADCSTRPTLLGSCVFLSVPAVRPRVDAAPPTATPDPGNGTFSNIIGKFMRMKRKRIYRNKSHNRESIITKGNKWNSMCLFGQVVFMKIR
ncbi:hypothetical protein Mapa_004877 [Marchantia paleacea]|nr:hypothetical protein Mapa_004877 [Marchantia paleacea]